MKQLLLTLWTTLVNFTKKLKPTETETNEFALSDILDSYKDHQSIIKIRSQKNDE